MGETGIDPEAILSTLRDRAERAKSWDPTVNVAYALETETELPGDPPADGAIRASFTDGPGESAAAVERRVWYWTRGGRLARIMVEDEALEREAMDGDADALRGRLVTFLTDMLPPAPPGAAPACRTVRDLAEHDGQAATVEGRYTEIDVRQRPTGRPEHRGHAALVLADGTQVLLEPVWSPHALRPRDERMALSGHMARATGTVHMEAPDDPDGAASLRLPCIVEVTEVRGLERRPPPAESDEEIEPC